MHSRLPRGVRPRLEGKPRTPLSSRLRALFSCIAWRAIPGPLSKRKRRLDSLEAAQGQGPSRPSGRNRGLPLRRRRGQSLGREDPLEKEMAIHSSILAWKIPWTEQPGGLRLPFGPRSQASLQKAQGPGVCKLPKPPASRALCQAKRAPRAAFPTQRTW